MPDRVRSWTATHVGLHRPNNEDRVRTSGATAPTGDAWDGWISANDGWAVVADGMGGHGAGELASEAAVERLARGIGNVDGVEALADLIQAANDTVHEAMFVGDGRPGMGTTVAGVILRRPRCTFFNVGDSRAYLLRGGELIRCSRDHTPEQGSGSSPRSHALTQSLGGTLTRLRLRPHMETRELRDGDVLLLCTDGLTDLVAEEVVASILAEDAEAPAARLVGAALAAGGRDNVTVAVLRA